MTTPDHQRTGSWGRGTDKKAYRDQQKQLIDTNGWNGFKDAMQMDIDDLHRNFGDQYDPGINQALAYVQENESELKQKFDDAVNVKENELLSPEYFELLSGDQAKDMLPAQTSMVISPEERKRLSETYSQNFSDASNPQEQTETNKYI